MIAIILYQCILIEGAGALFVVVAIVVVFEEWADKRVAVGVDTIVVESLAVGKGVACAVVFAANGAFVDTPYTLESLDGLLLRVVKYIIYTLKGSLIATADKKEDAEADNTQQINLQGWLLGGVHNSMVDWLCSTKIDKKFEKE